MLRAFTIAALLCGTLHPPVFAQDGEAAPAPEAPAPQDAGDPPQREGDPGAPLPAPSPAPPLADTPPNYLREDRSALPPAMPWQRTLDDALALSRATGKPILVCVNIDGELASEALAADRYRDPEFAALADGFVPLIVSPDRHDVLDHTSRGVRLVDSKFGRVTNAEHIAIEPELFERWFDGRRVAPRHLAVTADGEVLFDLYLLRDLTRIDDALREHGVFDVPRREPSELTEDELLASPDAAHREHLEARFLSLEAEGRAALAARALDADRETQHPELLRLGLLDPAPEVTRAALTALYRHPAAASVDLFSIALAEAAGDDSSYGESIRPALEHYAAQVEGAERDRADQLVAALRAWTSGSPYVDPERWRLGTTARIEVSPHVEGGWSERLSAIEEHLADAPGDAEWNVLFARNGRGYAESLIAGGGDPTLVLTDVQAASRRALEARPDDVEARALLAWSSYMLSDFEAALPAAREALPGLERWSLMPIAVDVLDVMADLSLREVYAAMSEGGALPAEALADTIAAHRVLQEHPLGTENQALRGFRMLGSLDLRAPQRRAIERGVRRWPNSGVMHEWLRWAVLRDDGPDGLLAVYDALELPGLSPAQRDAFAGLAALQAAQRREDERLPRRALDDYRAAVGLLEDAIGQDASVRDFARWYQVQARAARARIYLDLDRLDESLAELLLAFAIGGPAIDREDARGVSPRETLERVRDALLDAGRELDALELDRFDAVTEEGGGDDESGS